MRRTCPACFNLIQDEKQMFCLSCGELLGTGAEFSASGPGVTMEFTNHIQPQVKPPSPHNTTSAPNPLLPEPNITNRTKLIDKIEKRNIVNGIVGICIFLLLMIISGYFAFTEINFRQNAVRTAGIISRIEGTRGTRVIVAYTVDNEQYEHVVSSQPGMREGQSFILFRDPLNPRQVSCGDNLGIAFGLMIFSISFTGFHCVLLQDIIPLYARRRRRQGLEFSWEESTEKAVTLRAFMCVGIIMFGGSGVYVSLAVRAPFFFPLFGGLMAGIGIWELCDFFSEHPELLIKVLGLIIANITFVIPGIPLWLSIVAVLIAEFLFIRMELNRK